MPKKQKISEREHPLYTELIDEWSFFLQSVKGGRDYLDGGNLFTHRLESQSDDFEQRQERAYYLNFADSICSLYTNYIMRENVERPEDDLLDLVRKDINRKGDGIDTFISRVAFQSAMYGHVHVIVDMPDDPVINIMTKLDVKEEKVHPYCTIVPPTKLKDWSVDSNGKLNWIVIELDEYNDADPTVERDDYNAYKLITRDKWEVYDEDNKIISGRQGTNELGEIYLTTCFHKDIDMDMVGESLIKDIAYVNRIIYNWCSCIDEMIERQTFSQLVVPDDGTLGADEEGDTVLKKIGTSSIWTFPSDSSQAPKFISPDTENLAIIWDMIVAHVREIHRLAGLTGISEDLYTAQRSGKSQEYGFLNISTSLAAKARNLERVENEINRLCYKWMTKSEEKVPQVVYPTKFDVEGLAQAMEDTFLIVERQISERMNKELLKKLALKALPQATDEHKKEIENEIESGDGTIEPVAMFGGNTFGEPGRPAGDVGSAARMSQDRAGTKRSLRAGRKTTEGTQGGKPRE